MATTITTTEEPILSRLDRLDIMLRQLEEIRGGNRSPKSSCASTPSSGTLTSDGQASSDFSPKSLEKNRRRPIDDVIVETEVKGTLIERLVQVEHKVLKLEEELEAEKRREEKVREVKGQQKRKKNNLKGLVALASCVGKGKPKTRSD